MPRFNNRSRFFDKTASYRYLLEKIANEGPTPEQLAKIKELAARGRLRNEQVPPPPPPSRNADFSPPPGKVVSTPPPPPSKTPHVASGFRPGAIDHPNKLPTIAELINKPKATIGSGTNNFIPPSNTGAPPKPPATPPPFPFGPGKELVHVPSQPMVAVNKPVAAAADAPKQRKLLELLKNNKGKIGAGLAGLSLAGYGLSRAYGEKKASYDVMNQDNTEQKVTQAAGLATTMGAGGLAARNALNRLSAANAATQRDRKTTLRNAVGAIKANAMGYNMSDVDALGNASKRYRNSELLGRALNNKYTRGIGMGLGAVGMGAGAIKAYEKHQQAQNGY